MSKPPKIIFSARIDGVPRELLAVRQWKGSDLLIVSRHADHFQQLDGSYSLIKDQHYSVHQGSDDPTLTFVTQKTEFHDHPHLSFVSVIHASKPHLLWNIFSRRIPHFANGVRLIKARAKDSIVEIADFDQMKATLLYTVFVARPNFDVRRFANEHVRFHVAEFDKYKIVVLSTFLNVPNINEGDVLLSSTSSPKVNHEFLPGHFQINASSHMPEDMLNIHIEALTTLRNIMRARLHHFFGANVADLEGLDEMLQVFSPEPLLK